MNRRRLMKGAAAVGTVIMAGVSLGKEVLRPSGPVMVGLTNLRVPRLEQFERMGVELVESNGQDIYGVPKWEPVLFQDIQPEDMIRKTSTPDPAIYQVDSISPDGEVLNVSIVTSSYRDKLLRGPSPLEEEVLDGLFSF